MYTRTYTDEIGDIIIPERYGGTTLAQGEERGDAVGTKNPWESDGVHISDEQKSEEAAKTSAIPSKAPFGGIFRNILKNESLGLQKIGKEELLIIATAAFLFFSKEGDKECAIMLILLLFLG